MRQLTFHEPGRVTWEDISEPASMGDVDALVAPIAVAACDLDAALMKGAFPVAGPFPLGHEFVGRVMEVGDSVDGVAVGDKVAVSFQISCGECDRCMRGITGSCRQVNPG
ncbi:MAG TPA: alcohol dehydrogenase catalytic domain-containing protein, partial [Actinomycetota bacterium]|nr:alcohol dehydrogenase catalytic domain-containing protein [Actinomycetota bacterium]